MLQNIIILSTIVFLISCGQNRQVQEEQTNIDPVLADSLAILNDPKNNLNIQTNSFLEIDSSGILMFPLSMVEAERENKRLSYKSMPSNSVWNIIFLNSKTNEYHLLSDRKMLIRDYDVKHSSYINITISKSSQYIFYTVTCDDYNKDKKLTDEDPNYLFVSDKEGNNFKQISPINYHVQSWQLLNSANKVILIVKKDSDQNGEFDDTDEVTTFEVEMGNEFVPKEVFSTEFKNKLKVLYDRDWKRQQE